MKYIVSWSGGKDSTANIILAHLNKEPIDLIIFAEVMFDEHISGEYSEHIEFIKNVAIPLFESWGYPVKILHSDKTFMDCFNHRLERSSDPSRIGKKAGFPIGGRCVINRDCKLRAINQFYQTMKNEDIVQYIGIAIDEPERIDRNIDGVYKISLLHKYGYTEQMALELCQEYGLLSPIYAITKRGGCWFCPNARNNELNHMRKNHNDLWERLKELEKDPDTIGSIWNGRKGLSISDLEKVFLEDEKQFRIFDFF